MLRIKIYFHKDETIITAVYMLGWQDILRVTESTVIVACLQVDVMVLGNNFQDGTGYLQHQ